MINIQKTAQPPDGAQATRQSVMGLLDGFSVETTPGSAAKIPDYREHLRPGTTIYVTFLPGSDFADTVALCARLRGEGLEPVPHIAARSTPDKTVLEDMLARLRGEAEIGHVLVIGGAVDKPVGEFSDSMQLLETGLFDKYGIGRIGVAGHPEGSPDMPDEAIGQALAWKNGFAERTGAQLYAVTQFCFEAAPVIAWDKAIQAEGNRLPVHIGLPGPASLKALLGHARACGIGPSMRFLTRQAANVAKLMKVSAPDRLVTALADYRASDPDCGIAGVHLYPFGGMRRAALWTYGAADGAIVMNKDGRGFRVEVDL